ncbi:MAG: pyridoxal phosphate-dependent aminotransferase [Candidatus Diapherotrites archaeon]|nr:pyridoxal phosphate-dependent aminotransferase [Candidatus Diapherotrites archaeon]
MNKSMRDATTEPILDYSKLLRPANFIGASQEGIISFGSGQPDLAPPQEVFSGLGLHRTFKYGPVAGQDTLREALAKENPLFSKEHFVITNGSSEALDIIFRVLAKPKDKILIHTPYYYSYKPLLELNNFEPVLVNTVKGKIDMGDFRKKVVGVKAVLINSPSNPTGVIQEISALKEIEKITKDLDIPLVSDEVYKDLIYERENYSLSGPHVITVNSFSKTFNLCGLRVGYLFSNDLGIVNKVINFKSHSSMNTSILSQEMAVKALSVPKKFIRDQVKIWKSRRDLIYEGLTEMGLDLWKPEGAFYVFPKIDNPEKFVYEMHKYHKVITYPGTWFGDNERVRFSYALNANKIEEGLERVRKYLHRP